MKAKPGSHWSHASVWVLNPMTIHCVRGSRPWQVTGSELPKGCRTGRSWRSCQGTCVFHGRIPKCGSSCSRCPALGGGFPLTLILKVHILKAPVQNIIFSRFWNQRKHRTCPRPLSRSWPASSQRAGLGPQRPRCQAAADSATPKNHYSFSGWTGCLKIRGDFTRCSLGFHLFVQRTPRSEHCRSWKLWLVRLPTRNIPGVCWSCPNFLLKPTKNVIRARLPCFLAWNFSLPFAFASYGFAPTSCASRPAEDPTKSQADDERMSSIPPQPHTKRRKQKATQTRHLRWRLVS